MFVTKRRQCWFKESGKSNPISSAFKKLAEKRGIYRDGLNFYGLRHAFETIAGDSKDQVAVNDVMGHADAGITPSGAIQRTAGNAG